MSVSHFFKRDGDVVSVFTYLEDEEPTIVGSWNLVTDEGEYIEIIEVSGECIMRGEDKFWRWVCHMARETDTGGLSPKSWRRILEEVV